MSATTVHSREHLDALLLELDERGYGEAAAFGGQAYLLAAWEDGEASRWDAFSSHPYSCEGDPDGLARQLAIEDDADEGQLVLEGNGVAGARVIAVDEAHEHPGLDLLRYPLVVMHPEIGGPSPYLDEVQPPRMFSLTVGDRVRVASQDRVRSMIAHHVGRTGRVVGFDLSVPECVAVHLDQLGVVQFMGHELELEP